MHTPGPWGAYIPSQPYIIESKSVERTIVACLPKGDNWESNARVIAAAPDLLAALREAVARVILANAEGDLILSAWLPEAQAILARIDGEGDAVQ